MSTQTKPLKVAVIGGGIGGLCLTIGLLHHPHLEVQIYEAAHKFSEIGAGVAFGPNARRSLKLVDPKLEEAFLRQCTFNKSPEMKNTWFDFRNGSGPRQDEVVASPKNEAGQCTLHRAKILDEFVALVPKHICHFGKRLDRIQDEPGKEVLLHFKDDTTASADVVIGADGVHSVVREHLLGSDHPALHPTFTGSVAYRGLVPMRKALEVLGERYALNAHMFMGKDGCVMIYPVDFGETLNIVAINSTYSQWDGEWVQPAKYENIDAEFSSWGSTARSIVKLLDKPDTMVWSLWDSLSTPIYYGDRVAMMGDAAHSSTPFQGQGASQAIEDALVLVHLFGSVKDKKNVPMALQAFDKIRRPRAQKVCQTSREAGELIFMRLPSVMDNEEALKENIEWRMDWMWHHDLELERERAAMVYEILVSGESVD